MSTKWEFVSSMPLLFHVLNRDDRLSEHKDSDMKGRGSLCWAELRHIPEEMCVISSAVSSPHS